MTISKDYLGFVKRNWLDDYFSDSEGVGLKKTSCGWRYWAKTFDNYHIHLIENTEFLNDIFRKTKDFGPFEKPH